MANARYRMSQKLQRLVNGTFCTRLATHVTGHRALATVGGNLERDAAKRGCYIVKGLEYRYADCQPTGYSKTMLDDIVSFCLEDALRGVSPEWVMEWLKREPRAPAAIAMLVQERSTHYLEPTEALDIAGVIVLNRDMDTQLVVDYHFARFTHTL